MRWVDLSPLPASTFKKRLLVLTNSGMYIFRESASKPCSICPPENLCPEGPRLETKIKYEDITFFREFPLLPQRYVIVYVNSTIRMEIEMSFAINIP